MTKIYGQSDDLIEFEGDIDDEVNISSIDNSESRPMILTFDEQTKVEISYIDGEWKIRVLVVGHLFNKIVPNEGEYFDVLYMKDGLKSFEIEVERWL